MDKRINGYLDIRINPTDVPYGSVAWMIKRKITRSSELWSVCVVLCRSSHIYYGVQLDNLYNKALLV